MKTTTCGQRTNKNGTNKAVKAKDGPRETHTDKEAVHKTGLVSNNDKSYYEDVIAKLRAAGTEVPLFHPAADLFPWMPREQFEELVEDVRRTGGVREPVVMHEGKVLEGRHRVLASLVTGFPAATVEWDGKGDLVAYVVGANLRRRHLTDNQRATLAAELEQIWAKQSKQDRAKKAAAKRHKKTNSVTSEVPHATKLRARAQAAKTCNVTESKVRKAVEVREIAPDLLEQVKAGDVTLAKAHAEALRRQVAKSKPAQKAPTPKEITDKVESIRRCDFKLLLGEQREVNLILTRLPSDLSTVGEFTRLAAAALKSDGLVAAIIDGARLPEVIATLLQDGLLQYRAVGSLNTKRFVTKDQARRVVSAQQTVLLLHKTGANPEEWVWNLYVPDFIEPNVQSWTESVPAFESIVRNVARAGQTCVDPFCGTGTVLLACIRAGLSFVGGDADAKMVETAKERVRKELIGLKDSRAKLLGTAGDEEASFAA